MSKKKKGYDGVGMPPRVACITEYGSEDNVERITFVLTDMRTDKILHAHEFWAKDYYPGEMETEVDAVSRLYDTDELVVMHGHHVVPLEYGTDGKPLTIGVLRKDYLKYLRLSAEREREAAMIQEQERAQAEEEGGAT